MSELSHKLHGVHYESAVQNTSQVLSYSVLNDYRRVFEKAWTPETAHPDYRNGENEVKSYGQCVPTSVLLFEMLQEQYPRLYSQFELKSGRVLRSLGSKALDKVIPTHLWIGWKPADFHDIGVIDITGDQGGLDPVIFKSHDELAQDGVVYREHRTFDSVPILTSEFAKREKDVGERIRRLRTALRKLDIIKLPHHF